ncbi:MAG: (2Fe-2S) ferredoxin domain-containing protein, partial [Victivallaceae bacterium]
MKQEQEAEMTTVNLKQIAAKYEAGIKALKRRIVICAGTGCVANGAYAVRDELVKELLAVKLDVSVELDHHEHAKDFKGTYISKSGCQGF